MYKRLSKNFIPTYWWMKWTESKNRFRYNIEKTILEAKSWKYNQHENYWHAQVCTVVQTYFFNIKWISKKIQFRFNYFTRSLNHWTETRKVDAPINKFHRTLMTHYFERMFVVYAAICGRSIKCDIFQQSMIYEKVNFYW